MASGNSLSKMANVYVYSTAAALAILGLAMLLAAWNDRVLRMEPDPLFALTTRTLLLGAGILQLAVGFYLFIGSDLINRELLILWAGSSHLMYRLGVLWMSVELPPAVKFIGWETRIAPTVLNHCWIWFIGYLWAGSLICLLLQWRQFRQGKADAFENRWRQMREAAGSQGSSTRQTILSASSQKAHDRSADESRLKREMRSQSPIQSQSDNKIQAPKMKPAPGEFKFSCPSCGQHIKCDEGYSGRQINCPVCQEQILVPLPESARL